MYLYFVFVADSNRVARLTSLKMAQDRRKQLLSFKYNQRSQLNFSVDGLYGPKAQILENLHQRTRDKVLKESEREDPSCEHHLHWSTPPEMVLVVKKFRDEEVSQRFKELTTWLVKERHLQVIVEPSVLEEKSITRDQSFTEVKESLHTWNEKDEILRKASLKQVDFIICVGGDGTLLYTTSLFQETIPPIVSFHMGSLGFLTPFQFKNYKEDITRVLNGNLGLTLRHRLQCEIKTEHEVSTSITIDECPISPTEEKDRKIRVPFQKFTAKVELTTEKPRAKMLVMNEVVVDRGPSPYLTNLEIFCNGRIMTSVQGDGIIIATPTGSTAYSLAAGASMVHPSVPCMIVTPICPHSLSFRSIVVPAGVEITIRVAPQSRNTAWASFDGRNRQEIKQGDRVTVTTSKWPVPSINNTGHVTDWFDGLAECLQWNVRKQQRQMGV